MARATDFQYRPPTQEALRKRQNEPSGVYDTYVKDMYKMFKPKEGLNTIRIMPPTWKDHEGLPTFRVCVHYAVGAEGQSYLCLKEMLGEPCPVCEQARELKGGDQTEQDYANDMRIVKRQAAWLIDRDEQAEGPQIWVMPHSLDKDIVSMRVRGGGAALDIDDPDRGYDVEFEKRGQGLRTKYSGVLIARNDSPLHKSQRQQDDWMEYILENPLPECLIYHPASKIAEALGGGEVPRQSRERERDQRGRGGRDDDRRGRDRDDRSGRGRDDRRDDDRRGRGDDRRDERSAGRSRFDTDIRDDRRGGGRDDRRGRDDDRRDSGGRGDDATAERRGRDDGREDRRDERREDDRTERREPPSDDRRRDDEPTPRRGHDGDRDGGRAADRDERRSGDESAPPPRRGREEAPREGRDNGRANDEAPPPRRVPLKEPEREPAGRGELSERIARDDEGDRRRDDRRR